MFLGVLDTNINGNIHCLALRIIHWQEHVRPRDIVERLRDPKCDCSEEAADEIEKLRAALSAVIADIEDYERANNLHPNPGKSHCWESVRAAKAALEAK